MNRRLIARLDVKMEHLIKGIHLEGWRKVGDPKARARLYYEQGADELLYMDVVASLYGRNNLSSIVREVATEVFIPITVGGGIRSLAAVREMLSVGADKVAVNTAATQDPDILRAISEVYAQAAGVSLNRILHIEDVNPNQLRGYSESHVDREVEFDEEAPVSAFDPGAITVGAAVILTYSIKSE